MKIAKARFKMRVALSVWERLPSESLTGFRTLSREGNIPNPGFLAGVDDFDDALVGHITIATNANRLIPKLFGDGGKFLKELCAVYDESLDLNAAVRKHIDNNFSTDALWLRAFLCSRHGDIELCLRFAELPADDKKAK